MLTEAIRTIQERHHYSIGYRKMVVMLEQETGHRIGAKRLRRLMREAGLQSTVRAKRYSDEVYVRRRNARAALPPDLINRNFFALAPRVRFVVDITYLLCLEGTVYLNTIADLFNAEIVAYHYSVSVDTQLCLDTIEHFQKEIVHTDGVILHSDGGSTYLAYAYRELLAELGIRMSLGSRGDCYDNAAMESLNGVIKTECLYNRFGKTNILNRRISRKEVVPAVVEFIEFYNNGRPKVQLGDLSPVAFREQNPKGTYPSLLLADDYDDLLRIN